MPVGAPVVLRGLTVFDFIDAYNFGRRLKTLGGLTPYEFIYKCWTIEPEDSSLTRSSKRRD